ncbi:lysine N(6)-hydroxylase/L-ornithine N(5)-oxygenase family protein [Streptomyces morookaense]|uniref:L-lysine N6-monooxygenase MbtG n=1 Tax=Streptomyces morookaense TaxID=1970 RepID=A0A7Y7B4B5_STRMO|nr:SidA/IucD/PvdA family monooxygenase [Streptomyces morookaense]NVK78788.1 SidA/IucD/PvdA family monooxygenase [Streptomyces morookaense]GHF34770.1 monooxygenase [Streptomyces morookaense]
MTTELHPAAEPLDLLGVGVGPFNLSLAALADGVPGLRTAFFERNHEFRWHPGLLIEGTTLQVPFLADLVSLVDPSSPWSFLGHLKATGRLFPFYFAEKFHIDRAEYDTYCRWAAEALPHCRFGHQVDAVAWDEERQAFAVDYTYESAGGEEVLAGREFTRNLALGIGTEPSVPALFRPLVEDAAVTALHSADYLTHRQSLLAKRHVTVVGSGQSGAEVFLDLLRARPAGAEGLQWISRSPAFAPMEYSKLGLEQFTPDYTRYFHRLPERTRDELLPAQWQLYKGVSADTLGDIHDELYRRTIGGGWPDAVLRPATGVVGARRPDGCDGRIELELEHTQEGGCETLTTDAVVLATGYTERPADALLHGLAPFLVRDSAGRPEVDADQRLVLDGPVRGSVFVQNAERHTHGVGAPDLGLAAWRSAVILNALTGREVHRLPSRTAFTTFGIPPVSGPSGTAASGTGASDRAAGSAARA